MASDEQVNAFVRAILGLPPSEPPSFWQRCAVVRIVDLLGLLVTAGMLGVVIGALLVLEGVF